MTASIFVCIVRKLLLVVERRSMTHRRISMVDVVERNSQREYHRNVSHNHRGSDVINRKQTYRTVINESLFPPVTSL